MSTHAWGRTPSQITLVPAGTPGWVKLTEQFGPREATELNCLLDSVVTGRQFRPDQLAILTGPDDEWRCVARSADAVTRRQRPDYENHRTIGAKTRARRALV